MDDLNAFWRHVCQALRAERVARWSAARAHLDCAAKLAWCQDARMQIEEWRKRIEAAEGGMVRGQKGH